MLSFCLLSHPAMSCYVKMLSESYSNTLFNLRFLSSNKHSSRESPCRNKNRKEWELSRVLQGREIKTIAGHHLIEHCGSGRFPRRRDRLPTPEFLSFSGGSGGKTSTCNAGDLGSISGLGRSPGGGHSNPLQYSCLENPLALRSLVGYIPWYRRESDTTE